MDNLQMILTLLSTQQMNNWIEMMMFERRWGDDKNDHQETSTNSRTAGATALTRDLLQNSGHRRILP